HVERTRWPRFVASCILLITAAAAPAAPWGLGEALQEWDRLDLLQKPADPPRRFAQLSSWDRNEANFDQGNFLRIDGEEHVMMDVKGPGMLSRLWTAEPMGVLRFYWDGAEEPQLVVPWEDLAAG